MKKKIISGLLVTIIMLFLAVPSVVLALQLPNPLGNTTTVPSLIGKVMKGFLGILGAVALLEVVLGANSWLTAGGNEEKITKGKERIKWAIVGLVVIFLAYLFLNFVFGVLQKRAT